jgi:Lipid A 3-O-deacylase (PagL)
LRGAAAAALALSLGLLAASSARGEEPPLPVGRLPEWAVEAGYGITVPLNRGRSKEHELLFAPSASFRLSARLEYVAEAHFAQYFAPKGYMLGVLPFGGRFYFGSGRILPYVSIGAGLGWTNLERLDEIDQRFNFLLQGSLGFRAALSDRTAFTFEARLDHISDAGMTTPNLGLNGAVFLLGFRFR